MMWQNLICAGAMALGTISVVGGAAAQQPLADSLAVLSAFDCTDGETRTIYVFESSAEGTVTLLTSQAAAASIGDDGFATPADGASERVFVFRDGSTAKGICASVTDVARAAYPAITAALLPDIDEDSSAGAIATSLTIRDLKGRVQAAADDNMALQADLAVTQAEMADLRDALNQKALALSAQTEAMQKMREELAGTLAQLDMTEQDRRKLVAKVAVLNQSLSALQLSLRAANEGAEEATAEAKAMGTLADAAITWISTLQVRSAVAVRAEMCGTLVEEERPAVCP